MPLINVSDLTFGYEGSYDNIFENVSFRIDTDWKLGFIGRNGRGKTTFLKLLMGEYEYSGTISAETEFEYFPYHVPDDGSAAIDIIRQVSGAEDWEIHREISLLKADEGLLYRPFTEISMGERTKCLLAAMFLKQNSFLLIDEPTNHLDSEGRSALADYLSAKKGFILVSHDRALLDKVIDHVISINRTDIEVMKGNYSVWDENRRRRESFEMAENERLKKDIKRLESAAKRAQSWAECSERKKIGFDPSSTEKSIGRRSYEGAKAKKMMSRAKAYEERSLKAAEEKSALLKNTEKNDDLKLTPLQYRSDILGEVKNFVLGYGESSSAGVSFEIKRGCRTALCGPNGSGKSSILKAIMGMDIPCSGSVRLGSGVKISYVPQSADGLRGSLKEYADSFGIDLSLYFTILRKLDFSRLQFEKNLEELSSGQKKKAMIARSLCEKAHLYLWDEPLNYIDVLSRIQIEELITEYNPTLLFVEHDDFFTEKIADVTVFLG
ncbi:MAG: ribosomal protection-like ABC-F family protein [Huintestinicola sp.]